MSKPDETLILDILRRFNGDHAAMERHKREYPLLLTQTKGVAHVHPRYQYLLFHRRDDLELTDCQLHFLLGDNWPAIKKRHLARGTQGPITLDKDGGSIDMLQLPPVHWISPKFNILGREKGVKVYDERSNTCKSQRGMFLWQPKIRSNMNAREDWSRVPDILYLDFKWLSDERERFETAEYRDQRDFLCANLRLQRTDVVLPFVVDFTGFAYKDDEDARVTTAVNGLTAPKAAISIPGAAYIGWVSEMTPDQASGSKKTLYSTANRTTDAQWLLSSTQKSATQCHDITSMYEMARRMYQSPQQDSIVFYQDVLSLCRVAQDMMNDDDQ